MRTQQDAAHLARLLARLDEPTLDLLEMIIVLAERIDWEDADAVLTPDSVEDDARPGWVFRNALVMHNICENGHRAEDDGDDD